MLSMPVDLNRRRDMKYMALIYWDEDREPEMGTPDQATLLAAYRELNARAEAAGVLITCDPLERSSTATTVRVREGEAIATDGPFAETKEALGGFYLLDVPDLDAALEWAAQIPHAEWGTIEVRPLKVFG